MKGLTNDYIAIDTNVFGHLTDTDGKNADGHINRLLTKLAQKQITLLIDVGGKILAEYNGHLDPKKLKAKQKLNEAQLIDYWMNHAPKKRVVVDENTPLWEEISRIIWEESEENDRIFVYVAFAKGRILVSNDRKHITNPNRRAELKTCYTCPPCVAGADVMPSCEACRLISQAR
ncbi:MAG: hypothetical protein MPL62_05530 [Alphaproteobacteria bacterium]|nr:hypothetical protein [Alphaproteobacteria bacterium]